MSQRKAKALRKQAARLVVLAVQDERVGTVARACEVVEKSATTKEARRASRLAREKLEKWSRIDRR